MFSLFQEVITAVMDFIFDDDEDLDIVPQVFPIPPPPLEGEDLSIPPMNGVQYLQRAIEEKNKCEGVITVKMDLPPQPNLQVIHVPTKKECSRELLPSKDYQQSVTADFSKLRLKMESLQKKMEDDITIRKIRKALPDKEDDDEWLKICSLQEGPDVVRECAVGPSAKLCLSMSQVKIWHVLSYFPDWITEGSLSLADSCRWIYCLLACLELPMEPDVYFTLRQISRALMEHRAGLESQDTDSLPHINLIICIIGRYFRQEDLADPYV
ncbi:gem-associated protein 2 isoform X2 [Homalodisca vitripennis]|uniref:gem-associated protein 2 isoform X2 n=1 Tax=Homalodisca vitripennis TaxID=197043 RepID=UPI001EE9D9F8|nr:gem-associated protein 2 isoform X2 [Homalodisca vitripennis]